MRDKIISRIKALTSKTVENGATQAEMESALRKANQLAVEFMISEHELKDVEVIEKCVLKSFPLVKTGYDMSLFYGTLGLLFDCEHYYNNKTITFFGYSQDVELCGYFYQVIVKAALNEKDKYLKREENKYLRVLYHGKTISASFIRGFLIEVCRTINEMYEERESNLPQSFSLMVIDKKERVRKEYEELNLKVRIKKDKATVAAEQAFYDGRTEGENFKLTQGLEGKEESGKLIEYN